MANSGMKKPLNVPGMFYVTSPDDPGGEGCTACTACYTEAPGFFSPDNEGYAYVFIQPQTDEEIELCRKQLDGCPAFAIGEEEGAQDPW